MRTELSHRRFAKELAEFALRIESFNEFSSTARATFKCSRPRITKTKGMPHVPAVGPSLSATEGREQRGCPVSIQRLCSNAASKVIAGRESNRVSQPRSKPGDAPVGTEPETLVLVKASGFDKVVELRLSLHPASDATTVMERDFISMAVGILIRNSGPFRVVSNNETFTRWRTYLVEEPSDKFSAAAEQLLSVATMTKGSSKPQTDIGKLEEIYCGQYWWRRFYLTHRVFTTEGRRKNLSHARAWTPEHRSAS